LLAFGTDSGTVGTVDVQSGHIINMRTSHENVRLFVSAPPLLAQLIHAKKICGVVRFIPDRPSELVSGGYDASLLHFDHVQRSTLSSFKFGLFSPCSLISLQTDNKTLTGAPPPSSLGNNVSLSPPFVLSSALSSSGLFAVGTADGRLWVGMGAAKSGVAAPTSTGDGKKKRARKWEGLRAEDAIEVKAAEGPIVGL
jgi:hypothetical protein